MMWSAERKALNHLEFRVTRLRELARDYADDGERKRTLGMADGIREALDILRPFVDADTYSGAWRAPLCRRDDPHGEVEHNAESLAALGVTCACACHAADEKETA